MRDSHYSPFLLPETPRFSELLWAPSPGPPLRLSSGDLTAPPDPQLARAMTFACRHDIIINPTNCWWWWFEGGRGVTWNFHKQRGGTNNFSAASRGIKNLTESFIPFLPHPPCELKNDNFLTQPEMGGNKCNPGVSLLRENDGGVRRFLVSFFELSARSGSRFSNFLSSLGPNFKFLSILSHNFFIWPLWNYQNGALYPLYGVKNEVLYPL